MSVTHRHTHTPTHPPTHTHTHTHPTPHTPPLLPTNTHLGTQKPPPTTTTTTVVSPKTCNLKPRQHKCFQFTHATDPSLPLSPSPPPLPTTTTEADFSPLAGHPRELCRALWLAAGSRDVICIFHCRGRPEERSRPTVTDWRGSDRQERRRERARGREREREREREGARPEF